MDRRKAEFVALRQFRSNCIGAQRLLSPWHSKQPDRLSAT